MYIDGMQPSAVEDWPDCCVKKVVLANKHLLNLYNEFQSIKVQVNYYRTRLADLEEQNQVQYSKLVRLVGKEIEANVDLLHSQESLNPYGEHSHCSFCGKVFCVKCRTECR